MNLNPLPGFAIIELEALFKNTGNLVIPERYKNAPHIVGKIIVINMRPVDIRFFQEELIPGERVIVTPLGGRHVEDNNWLYPVTLERKDIHGRKYRDSGIMALIRDDVEVSAHTQEIERCAFCGPARSGSNQNVIMVNGGCPRCGKNKHGEVPDTSLKVTDAEVERFEEINRK